jgi:undecaprenyl-diphosphatase
MSGLEALLLGVVQGLTEFLPVSSSGHLVILQRVLGAAGEGVGFEVAVHLATLGSVLVFYRRVVAELVVGALQREPAALRYGAKLALATVPAVAAVLVAGDFFEAQFESARTAGIGLVFTGLVLWTTRRTTPAARGAEPGWVAALLIGCAQAVAIVPGVSRSGATVAAALALGVAPVPAAQFSFLMSVIAIAGAAGRTLPELTAGSAEGATALLIGGAAALASGLAAIWAFLRLLRARSFHHFAFYAWAVGGATLLWLG